ncbi:hypothetical protein AB0O91_19015 [Kitasatospora sp. NPDC089797]|uniref:hypothetical protein n=1 Tax=Kitasatospora sp. NPDC089797 TaxID=3155298 RepID=UPI003413DBBB
MLTRKTAVAAVAVAAAGVLGAATTASAATTLYDTKSIVLNIGRLGPTCTSRTVDLAAGSYSWGWADRAPEASSTVQLAAGSYTWTDCLSVTLEDHEFLTSSLQPVSGGSGVRAMRGARWLPSGPYTFGSFLRPNF